MSAEFDTHTETESEDGGILLAKVESDEMDIDTGSDTTPNSQDSGESSSSSANAWDEMPPSSFNEFTEHAGPAAEPEQITASFDFDFGNFHYPMSSPFSVPQAAWSTTSHGDPHGEWTVNYYGLADDSLLQDGMQASDSLPSHFSSAPSEVPQTSTETLPTATNNVTATEPSEPTTDTSENETAQIASQHFPEEHPTSVGIDPIDESEEAWLAQSEDSYNIFSTDIAQINGTLQTLNQASHAVSNYDHDDLEEEEESNFFSVSFFLYHWKQMCTMGRPDYPSISSLANNRAKVQRPDKITASNIVQCDYQGIHWSRFQTTKQEAREVRRMTYRNLTNLSPHGESFGTQAFKANFSGAVLPTSDSYFTFKEMDMKRRPEYCHYQLRHNLSATSKNAIFYTHRPPRHDATNAVSVWETEKLQHTKIVCFNPETGTDVCAMDVSKRNTKEEPKITRIHTLAAGNGVLVAGSYDGVYAMKSLSSDFGSPPLVGTIAVGSDVSTNHIHTFLDRQSGLPRVVFDSNDKTISILDCITNKWVACHKYPYQVNCSATSPDGRLRLLNGDDCEPIIAIAETGETYTKLPGHTDYGFACDWAPDGITMATGHQDGLVKVWDARRLNEPIQTIAMEQAGCRSLQFSPLGSGKRVLVLAEPADFVHIVDARTFKSRQTIDFFGEISGISMPPDGSNLYIANADARYGGLLEFQRSQHGVNYDCLPCFSDLDDEHEEMVDCILDGVQQRNPADNRMILEKHMELFMHGQGLPIVASSMIEGTKIRYQSLFLQCFEKGGGHAVTASGQWPIIAEKLGIPRGRAVSGAQQLHAYWRDNLAPYEMTVVYARRLWDYQQSRLPKGQRVERPEPLPFSEQHQYRRDCNDPRRKSFKIGRRSESLDWLSESDMEDDFRVKRPRGQRGLQWTPRPEIDDDLIF